MVFQPPDMVLRLFDLDVEDEGVGRERWSLVRWRREFLRADARDRNVSEDSERRRHVNDAICRFYSFTSTLRVRL